MSNGFFFIPTDLYNRLDKHEDGPLGPRLKEILLAFIQHTPDEQAAHIAAYAPAEDGAKVCFIPDDHGLDYPTVWGPVAEACLALRRVHSDAVWTQELIAVALDAHFNPKATPSPAFTPNTAARAKRMKLRL